jgi:hypothetical protein
VCATSGASLRDRLLRDTCFATLASDTCFDTCFATVASRHLLRDTCFATARHLLRDTCFATARHLLRDTCFATLARNRHLQLIIPPASIPVGYKKKTLRFGHLPLRRWATFGCSSSSPARHRRRCRALLTRGLLPRPPQTQRESRDTRDKPRTPVARTAFCSSKQIGKETKKANECN